MRINVASWLHIIVSLASLNCTLDLLCNLVSLKSNFPWDILEEISNIDFTKFNNDTGSHITLIPAIVHYFIFNQSQVDFLTVASVKSSLMAGLADVVYIHHLDTNLTGRYIESLLSDPFFKSGENLLFNMFDSSAEVFADCRGPEEKLLRAQLIVLTEMGGMVLPGHSLVLRPLAPLLSHEAWLHWPRGAPWEQAILMCHKAARLPRLALELSKHDKGGAAVVEGLLAREPGLVTRASRGQQVGEVGEAGELRELYRHHILVVPDYRGSGLEEAAGGRDALSHLLRTAWLR